MKTKKLLLCISVFCSVIAYSQTKEDVEKIIRNYDLEKIKAKEIELRESQAAEKRKALELAKINHWPEFRKTASGQITDELMGVTPDGFPLYYSINNIDAAKSTRANHLNAGGSLGLSLDGEGMVARVWDQGKVRTTHVGFGNRVTFVNNPNNPIANNVNADHATHVTGTILGTNIAPANNTKGMASKATSRNFHWANDETEALSEARAGMLLSSHSYGIPVSYAYPNPSSANPAWYIGAYTERSRVWDEIAYLAPYYLPVRATGNDGLNDDNTAPIAAGYDKLAATSTSKNLLTVANAQDANVAADGSLISVAINGSSSQGPTDDRRIKPDITGNGTTVTSFTAASDTATASYTGTSMASPNVMGTLLLVQQHSKNISGGFMKAATLKGLACHTADDAGNPGPDPVFGWGLLNAKKAVETLNQNGLQSWVSEETLSQGQTFTKTVTAAGGTPLIASITWTDVPGVARVNTPVNDPTPALVNDLDIRITRNGVTSYPWKLQANPASNAVRNADNNVDNVERINIDAPVAGDYTITITHKGNLVNNHQDFSLVVTGLTSTFAINPTSDNLTVCDNQNAVFNFNYKQTGSGTTNFSAVGLPSGAVATFNNNSLSANGTVVMTVSGLSNVALGEYTIGLKATNGTEIEIRNRTLKVYKSTFQNVVLTYPANGQNPTATATNLKWDKDANAESYRVEVATDANFTNIVSTSIVTDNTKLVNNLNQGTTYYWRVFPKNRCGEGTNPTVFIFHTGTSTCGFNFTATDFSDATISTAFYATASVPVTVTGGHTIGDLNVSLAISHPWIQDIIITLEGPAAVGSPVFTLLRMPCEHNSGINCTLDDSGTPLVCGTTTPAISGTVLPFESLSNFNNLNADGVWTLHVLDKYRGDGGSIDAFSLNICKLSPQVLGSAAFEFANVNVFPNPTEGILNISLPQNTQGETSLVLFDIQGRQVLSKITSNATERLNVGNLQNGVYLLSIENKGKKATKKIILNK